MVKKNIFADRMVNKFSNFDTFMKSLNKDPASSEFWKTLNELGPEQLYTSSIINSKRISGDDIAEWLLDVIDNEQNKKAIDLWTDLKPLRKKGFFTPHHNEKNCFKFYSGYKGSRSEEILAKILFLSDVIQGLGHILDYQVPLKEKRSDKIGKIDLVGYSEKTNRFSLIELKYHQKGNQESLLRCVLEAYTYYKRLDRRAFVKEYIDKYPNGFKGEASIKSVCDFKNSYKFELVILFGGNEGEEYSGPKGKDNNVSLLPRFGHEEHYNIRPSRQYNEFDALKHQGINSPLYRLCKYIAVKESILIRFCLLDRDTTASNNNFIAAKFYSDKNKTQIISSDWNIGEYFIKDEILIDHL